MRSHLIRGDQVTALSDSPASIPDGVLIRSAADFNLDRFSVGTLAALWNGLPGVEPVKRFKDRTTAVKRLWAAFEALPLTVGRSDSKQARLLVLLQRSEGASMEDLMAATGWQRHSVRGVLSGVIRKKLGRTVTSLLTAEGRIYRVAA